MIEDATDDDPQYLALLAAISEAHHRDATPADYARAALRPRRTARHPRDLAAGPYRPHDPPARAGARAGDVVGGAPCSVWRHRRRGKDSGGVG